VCLATVLLPAGAATAVPLFPGCTGAIRNEIFVGDVGAFPGGPSEGGFMRIDGRTGVRTAVSGNANPSDGPTIETPMAMGFHPDGDLVAVEAWWTSAEPAVPGVMRIGPTTGYRLMVSSDAKPRMNPGFTSPHGLAVEETGQILVTDAGTGGNSARLLRVNPVSGYRYVLSSNLSHPGPLFNNPTDVAVAPNGTIVVLDSGAAGGRVIAVNPTTGRRTLISSNISPGTPPFLATPWGVTVEPDGAILVSDPGLGGTVPQIVRVDPATGDRELVSMDGAPGSGVAMEGPGDLVYHCDTILVTDIVAQAVLRIDPTTGVRTVLSDNTTGHPGLVWPWGIAARAAYP
jgi:sugar lactone lactonase YvrE